MKERRGCCSRLVAAVATLFLAPATLSLAPATSFAFPQGTETSGELPMNLNGIWFVVHQIEFPRPSPGPTPAAAAEAVQPSGAATPPSGAAAPPAKSAKAPAPAPAAPPAAQLANRSVTAINLFQIRHLPTTEAQKMRDAERRMQEASVAKANALVEEERKKSIPMQTESGEVEGPKVIVPSIPRRPEDPTDRYDETEIKLLDVAFPQEIDESLTKANKAEAPWNPSAKELALLKSSWSAFKPSGKDEYSRIEWKVYSAEFMDEGLKQDDKVRDAKIAITSTWQLIPKKGQPDRLIMVYGARELTKDLISGGHVRAIMASAPFPIPIDMKGSFKMYKLAALPKEVAEIPWGPVNAPPAAKPSSPAKPEAAAAKTEAGAAGPAKTEGGAAAAKPGDAPPAKPEPGKKAAD